MVAGRSVTPVRPQRPASRSRAVGADVVDVEEPSTAVEATSS